jgi:hypothetical protein
MSHCEFTVPETVTIYIETQFNDIVAFNYRYNICKLVIIRTAYHNNVKRRRKLLVLYTTIEFSGFDLTNLITLKVFRKQASWKQQSVNSFQTYSLGQLVHKKTNYFMGDVIQKKNVNLVTKHSCSKNVICISIQRNLLLDPLTEPCTMHINLCFS